MKFTITYKHISPNILELCWPAEISRDILLDMMAMKNKILSKWQNELWDVNLGYHRLSLHFKIPYVIEEVISQIEVLQKVKKDLSIVNRKRWTIPVWYNGRDLERVAHLTGLSTQDIISLHQTSSYLLYFYGFMPGFMYLGGLSEKLFAARKDKPDPKINKGSVAIGGKQTGIYPMDSPGGWNIIGQTPVPLFDLKQNPPVKASPGDEISFKAISKANFENLSKAVERNNYTFEYEEL